MVKKYKLTSLDNQNQKGGSLDFFYPVIPSMTGLTPSTAPLISSKLMVGSPLIPGGVTALTSNGSYIRTDPTGGLKIGMPLVSGTGDGLKMIIPPRIDPRDPSVFLAVESKPKTGASTPIKDVTLSFKEPMPKQSLVMYQPTLPMLPNPYGLQLPVGLQPSAPIVINPTDSKARMEISSPESDDIITVSGEQDKIKPVYEGIQKNNKVRIAQEEVTLAEKAFTDKEATAKTGKDFDANYRGRTADDLEKVTDKTDLPDAIRAEVLRLKKARESLQKAKKDAGMTDDDTDAVAADLIPLNELFDISKVIAAIKGKFSLKDDEFKAEASKKNSLQLLLGLPYKGGLNYGPVISGL
jgi:hypothetical protein